MTARKAPAGVYDADAARAARREVAGEPFVFTFGGEQFTIESPKEWPMAATGFMAKGDLSSAMELLMGEQFLRFSSHAPTLADVEGIMSAVAEWQGITLGE